MFKGKVVWITGASSGIGAALAKQLARQGARLILSGRRAEQLARVAAACGQADSALILPFETTDYEALPGIAAQAWAHSGHIDCLVNNAGISQRSLAVDTAFSVYQRIVDVDLMAPIALTQLLLPRMVAQKSGRFIVISSVAGKVGSPLRTAYSAAKHGLFGYFDALRAETAMHGIEVHVVAPGSIKTDVSRNALTADGSARGVSDPAIEAGMVPTHAAKLILRAVERGDREIVIARGLERKLIRLRRAVPNQLYDYLANIVAQSYVEQVTASVDLED